MKPGIAILGFTLLLGATGCTGAGKPRVRLGSLPFPGLFTLYAVADPANLGHHRYGRREADRPPEVGRGIIYTCRAGFVDLSHIRDTIDLARCFQLGFHEALASRHPSVELQAMYPSRFMVTLGYPAGWESLSPERRSNTVDELSIRYGLQLAWIATTWHEIITWFGYKMTGILPEDQSAFTYDDNISHAVGLQVVDRALHDMADGFDDAVTRELDRLMLGLHAQSPDQTEAAVAAVKGRWWRPGRSLKRHLDIGLGDNLVQPWLVPGLDHCPDEQPDGFSVPPLSDLVGDHAEPGCHIEIDPNIWESGRIRDLLPGRPSLIQPAEHFPIIMQAIRAKLVVDLGESVDRPD